MERAQQENQFETASSFGCKTVLSGSRWSPPLGPGHPAAIRAQLKADQGREGRILRINKEHSKRMAKSSKRSGRYPLPEKPRQKRSVIQDMVRPLKQWLLRHRHNPYPTKAEKVELAIGSNMTLVQVSNWFANARRRLKNVVQDPKCSWSRRLRMYNQFVQGNAELLSIASDDSIWNSNDEDEEKEEEGGGDCRLDDPFHLPSQFERDGSSSSSLLSKYKTSMLQRYLSDSVRSIGRDEKSLPHQPRPILPSSLVSPFPHLVPVPPPAAALLSSYLLPPFLQWPEQEAPARAVILRPWDAQQQVPCDLVGSLQRKAIDNLPTKSAFQIVRAQK